MRARLIVDEAMLHERAAEFLQSPAGAIVIDELELPIWVGLLFTLLCLALGCVMLPTVVMTVAGFKLLWSVVRLEPLFAMSGALRRQPETLLPVVGHGIIIGPDKRHALALGTFLPGDQFAADRLARKAADFAAIYRDGPKQLLDETIYVLLHDDNYRPFRRRRVPEPFAEGAELWLFDVDVNLTDSQTTPHDTVIFAFLAEPGKRGPIKQIPWAVFRDAVYFAEF